jgi:uncharacterized protein (TIRG00374 family)
LKIGLRGVLGFALSAFMLWFAFRDVDVAEVSHALARADMGLLILASAAGTSIFFLRAIRWRPILAGVVPGLPYLPLFRAVSIGMAINNLVPARAGEIARAFALNRERRDVPFSAAFASIAVDRIFDAAVVVGLMLLAMLDPAFPRDTPIAGYPALRWIGAACVVLGAALVVLAALAWFPAQVERLFELVSGRVAPAIEARGIDFIRAFTAGLGVLRHPGRAIVAFLWTIAHWLMNGVAFWIAFKAVGINAPLSAGLFLQGLISIGVAVPAAPGFFGVFEALGKAGLALYGVPGPQAVTWAVGFHIVSYIPVTLMGIAFFARLGMSLGDLAKAAEAEA